MLAFLRLLCRRLLVSCRHVENTKHVGTFVLIIRFFNRWPLRAIADAKNCAGKLLVNLGAT